MKGHEFIFSKKTGIKLLRHVIFWLSCWLYISLSYYFIQQSWMLPGLNPKYVSPGAFILIKSLILVLAYTMPCYTFIYLILPDFINRKWKALWVLIPLIGLMYGLGYFMYWNVFPVIDHLFGISNANNYPTRFWPAVVLGLVDPLKIIAAAAIIKYVKNWWMKQKEKEMLEQEKLNAELQLLKSQISPGFLCKALDNIYEFALAKSSRTPELLMKLSDLLSYMVYECEATFVPLEKEIERMKDFMELQIMCLQDTIETEITVTGETNGKMIAPFLLLPFIDYCFMKNRDNPEQVWINLDITVSKDEFTMKLASSLNISISTIPNEMKDTFADVQKRLYLLYPHKHELKFNRESEMLIVLLKIRTDHELVKTVERIQLKSIVN